MVREDSSADSPLKPGGGTVHVIATSVEGTREALEAATTLARGLSGRVVVFVRDPGEASLRQLANSYMPRPNVLSCVCKRVIDVVQLFQRRDLVGIGGETRWWWPTAEERLARALTRLGCRVTFVHVLRREFTLAPARVWRPRQ